MKKYYPDFLAMLGVFLLVDVAYGLDKWIDELRRVSQQDFSGALTWVAPAYLANVFMVCLLLIWLGFAHYKVQKNRMASLIYIVLGAGLPIYNMVVISSTSNSLIPLLLFVGPQSLTSFVSAFIAGFGLQRLIFGQFAF